MDQFHHTVFGNFLYKVMSKVFANRLAVITSMIDPDNQFGFTKCCHIEDCNISASVCVVFLKKKRFGGNLDLKVDNRKMFDLLS